MLNLTGADELILVVILNFIFLLLQELDYYIPAMKGANMRTIRD
jgi:hypothetical protein